MKRYNFRVDSDNVIIEVKSFNIDETQPILEVDDDVEIFPGYTTLIDGQIISNKGAYLERKDIVKELSLIKAWFQANDWKNNKIIVGEWTREDPRWIEYLEERKIKRARQDELDKELKSK